MTQLHRRFHFLGNAFLAPVLVMTILPFILGMIDGVPVISSCFFLPTSAIAYGAQAQQYTISGRVTDESGVALGNVVINGLPGPPRSGSDGSYSVTVSYGWLGQAKPTRSCYDFRPLIRRYSAVVSNQSNQDYTGYLQKISGRVTFGGTALAGVVMDGLPGTPSTAADGTYSVTVPCGWTGKVTPGKNCYAFNPTSRQYQYGIYDNFGVTSSIAGQDFSASPGSVEIRGSVRRYVPFSSTSYPVSGVTITGFLDPPVTGGDGTYSAKATCFSTITLKPEKPHYQFEPSSRTGTDLRSSVDASFRGIAWLAISGQVRRLAYGTSSTYFGVSGVQMVGFPGNPVSTSSDGYYTGWVPPAWSGTITPSSSWGRYNPPSRSYGLLQESRGSENYDEAPRY